MDRQAIERIAQEGESETVEFKKSTAQLRRAAETHYGIRRHPPLFGMTSII